MRKLTLFTAAAGAAGLFFSRYRRAQRRISFDGATVVITGARGLALDLARLFAEEGARIALLARSAEELERARDLLAPYGSEVFLYPCDVRDRAQVQQTVAAVTEACGRIDVLVNNAGVIQVGPVEHMTVEDFDNAMAVHTWGPLYLMQAISAQMKRYRQGRIVNISSIGGLVAVPHLLPYVTSKFALVGLSDGMRAELAKDGIRVTTVCPGLMRTGSHVNALFKGRHEKEFAWFSISAAFPLLSTDAPSAARRIVEACRHGDPRLIITPQAHLLHGLDALFPGLTSTFQKLAARLLPGPADARGDRVQRGWDSQSALAPSVLTAPADRAIAPHNEQNGREAGEDRGRSG